MNSNVVIWCNVVIIESSCSNILTNSQNIDGDEENLPSLMVCTSNATQSYFIIYK